MVTAGDSIRLPEYTVGVGRKICTYPGIMQCFAIAGWTPEGMVCTHVSPGATKQDIADTFDFLAENGGKQARYWYVLGPFTDHFKVKKAQWKSKKGIQDTFNKKLGKKSNTRFILDATEERNIHNWGITIRAEHRHWEGMIKFSYAPSMGKDSNAQRPFKTAKFTPF